MMQIAPVEKIRKILRENKIIAVVGLSPRIERPSNLVASYMEQAGYRIVPVNPGHDTLLGHTCYPDLQNIPFQVDIVNIFRRSELVEPIIHDAIAIGARVIWMQEGIVNNTAAKIAEDAGMEVIMDRCIKVDHQNFMNGSAQ